MLADVNPVALEQAVHALGPQASAQVVDLTSEAAREGLVRAVQQQAGWAGMPILAITGPIYLCIALGFAAVRWRVFSPADMRVMGKFVIQFALPALLFNALASRPLAELLQPAYLLAFGTGSVVWLLVSLWLARRVQGRGVAESAYMTMGMTCGNSTFIGYPVVLLAIGPLAGVALAMNLLVENLIKLPLLMTMADVGSDKSDQTMLLCQQHCLVVVATLPAADQTIEMAGHPIDVETEDDRLVSSLAFPPPGHPPKAVVI